MPVIKRILRELVGGGAQPTAQSNSAVSIDARSLMKLKNLELRAKIVFRISGGHSSQSYHGVSVEFTDYRQYSPGRRHSLCRLALVRTPGSLLYQAIRRRNQFALLPVGRSQPVDELRSLAYDKMEYARTCIATLAYYLSLQRDAVGLLTFDEEIGDYLPPRYRPGHLRRLMLSLERATSGTRTSIAPPLERIARTSNKRGLIVLVSDLLAPIDDWHQQLGYLRSRGHEVIVLRILDPAEVDFTFDTPKIFEDAETVGVFLSIPRRCVTAIYNDLMSMPVS